jgi:regulator of replication initiation timing
MDSSEVLYKLAMFNRRLATLADQVHELREQAQHTLDRMHPLRDDIEQTQRTLRAECEQEQTNASLPQTKR